MSSASLRQGTIVLMELRCSPHLPALLLPSSSPPSPWHNCCIAADAISCFLSGISAVGPHLTLSSLLSDSPLLFAVESLSPIALHSLSLCHASPSNRFPPTPSLCISPKHVPPCSAMFLLFSSPIYLFVFAVLIVLLFSSLSYPCSEG